MDTERPSPRYSDIDVWEPADVLDAKKAEILADPSVSGKPEEVRGRIVDGQLRKWYEQVVLFEQPFRDQDISVGQLVTNAIATIGENIRVRRFTRYALGEELLPTRPTASPGCATGGSCSSCPARR